MARKQYTGRVCWWEIRLSFWSIALARREFTGLVCWWERRVGFMVSRAKKPLEWHRQSYTFEPRSLDPVYGHACGYHNWPLSDRVSPTYGSTATVRHPHVLSLEWLDLYALPIPLPCGKLYDYPRRAFES